MASIFSKIVKGEIPSYKVAEDEYYYAFLDINPLQKGHTLVIPKKETDYLFDLSDEELAGLMVFAKKVARAIGKTIPCQRVGVAVLGLDVPHAHVHLVPLNGVSGRIHNHIFVAIDSAQAFISSAGNCFLGLQKFISSPPLRGTR